MSPSGYSLDHRLLGSLASPASAEAGLLRVSLSHPAVVQYLPHFVRKPVGQHCVVPARASAIQTIVVGRWGLCRWELRFCSELTDFLL